MLKVYVTTNGCVEGQLSSTYVEEFFRKNKLTITKDLSQADLIVFYACGLTEQKEKDSLAVISKLQAKSKPTAKLIVWGCLPKINPKALSTVYNGPIIGPMDTAYFEEIFERTTVTFNDIMGARAADMLVPPETLELYNYPPLDAFTNTIILLKERWGKLKGRVHKNTRFYIRTAAGCTGRCTYCSERCAFGRIKSRPIEKILSEFKWGLQRGYNQFSLIATDLGAYGRDMGCTLSDLLTKMIEVNNEKNYKIILNQVCPSYLIEMFSDLEKIFASKKVEVLNCPVQSGSDRILKLMGRAYTSEEWREHMLKINRRFPYIKLSTHFMVGFPSETDDDFDATLNLLNYPLFLHDIYIFKFSKRPTVYASLIPDQISEKTKELRCRKLLQKYAYMYVLNSTGRCIRGIF
ncbi:MAG: radical SAM protein [Candidatus Jordarchaeaceae archaeon]